MKKVKKDGYQLVVFLAVSVMIYHRWLPIRFDSNYPNNRTRNN